MKIKLPGLLLYLLLLVLLLNLCQAHFTQLIFDEAYYWYYARELQWGYFDHPPMVALMVKLGELFFTGELGVRFLTCLMSVGTMIFLWVLIDNPKKKDYVYHFVLLCFSLTLVNAYGFFTLPDTPLLFFISFFLWAYKAFLKKPGLVISLLLGLAMALMMYSKYHAVLVIVFVILSNPALVRSKWAWVAVAFSLLCYTPHWVWLHQHDYVTLKYHISERPNRAYEFGDFTLGYFVNLVAIFGLTFPWIYRALYRSKPTDLFTKALLFLVYGILIFFFISSFNRRIQTQWIIAVSLPMFLLAFQELLRDPHSRKWLTRMAIVNVVLLLYLRLGLIFPSLFPVVYESHGNKEWVSTIVEEIGDRPVVFENSYREAPMYSFYSGNPAYSLNNIWYRKNQYSIDNSEAKLQGRDVLYVAQYMREADIDLTYYTPDSTAHYGRIIENFESFRKLSCTLSPVTDEPGTWNLEVYNPYDQNIPLEKLEFAIAYLNPYKQLRAVTEIEVLPLKRQVEHLSAQDHTAFKFQLPAFPEEEEIGYLRAGISENGLLWGLNGTIYKLE